LRPLSVQPNVRRLAFLPLALTCLGFTGLANADLTFRRPGETNVSTPGAEVVPIRVVSGQIYVEATLHGPSGRDVSGLLVLDTGAPRLVVGLSAWNALDLDTLVLGGSFMKIVRRSLAIEMSSVRLSDFAIGGVVADSLLEPGVIGLFAPSLIEDRALVLDYQGSRWSIVPPRLAVVASDSATNDGGNLTRGARIRRSRAAYAAVLAPEAVAVPFRLFEGGRILVTARATDPARGWRGEPLTLLFDTGASACVLFDDVIAERVARAPSWPWLRGVPMRTMVGTSRMNATVVPALQLEDASRPLALTRVDVGVADRRALPEMEGTLPERIHGLLGTTFLERFQVVLDYGNQVLWLRPRPSAGASSLRSAHVGLRLERRWGGVRVAAVAPGSSADRAGIVVGDQVISIGGASLTEADTGAAEELLQGEAGSEVAVVTRHETWERVHRLRRDSKP
jgi:hypothetical protein